MVNKIRINRTKQTTFNKLRVGLLSLASLLTLAFALPTSHAKSKQLPQINLSSGLATPVMEAGKNQNAFIRVALTGFEIDRESQRTPLNVAIVLDQSSSMSGQKIRRAKEAANMAVRQLNNNDVISIITYDSTVDVLVPATKATDKQALYRAIRRIKARGNTALFAGTSKGAYEVRKFLSDKRVNRVVLLSDGMANVGPSSPSDLGGLGRALAKDGMSVSTIGLGLGYNEDLMTQLANYSDGNHSFVENSADLARVFEKEFGEASSVVAQDVDIQIILEKGIKPIRIVGRDGDIVGNKVFTRMNQIYSQQESYVVLEVNIPAGQVGEDKRIANVSVNYNHMLANRRLELADAVSASFTASKEEVKESINKPVYEAAIEQVANERSKEAIELRDKGDIVGAQQKLKQNSSLFSRAANYISSDRLSEKSLEADEDAESVQAPGADWNKKRKELKAKSYKLEKQQR